MGDFAALNAYVRKEDLKSVTSASTLRNQKPRTSENPKKVEKRE